MRHTVPMSYLDRIAECNDHDLSRYVPFVVGEQRVGWIRRDRSEIATGAGGGLRLDGDRVVVSAELGDFETRSAAVAEVVDELARRDEISPFVGEKYPVKTSFGAVPLLQVERVAVAWFGVRAYGIHVNGFVRRGGEPWMWIARRARD